MIPTGPFTPNSSRPPSNRAIVTGAPLACPARIFSPAVDRRLARPRPESLTRPDWSAILPRRTLRFQPSPPAPPVRPGDRRPQPAGDHDDLYARDAEGPRAHPVATGQHRVGKTLLGSRNWGYVAPAARFAGQARRLNVVISKRSPACRATVAVTARGRGGGMWSATGRDMSVSGYGGG
jgi:hypothetical protein